MCTSRVQQVKDHFMWTSHAAGKGSLLWTFLDFFSFSRGACRITGFLSNFLESKIGRGIVHAAARYTL